MSTPMIHRWQQVDVGSAAVEYARMILNRVQDGMPVEDWSVDWADAPWDQKHYPAAQRVWLAEPAPGRGIVADPAGRGLAQLADLMFLSYGLLGQRARVNANDHPEVLAEADRARWGRGAASGGGRYCASVYLVTGAGFGLPAGAYHYSPAHRALETLALGDWTGRVAAIQGYADVRTCYVVVTIKYWQSAFKYNDFAYQATAMDIGTMLGTWQYLLGDDGADLAPDLWVDEPALAAVLGIDSEAEGVYAVLPWGAVHETPMAAGGVRVPEGERSARVVAFATQQALQRDAALERDRPPEPPPHRAVPTAAIARLDLPGRAPLPSLTERLAATLRRETSFGRFDGRPLARDPLLSVLEAAAHAPRMLGGQLGSAPHDVVRLYVYAENVEGLDVGLYDLDAGSRTLRLLEPGGHGDLLASTYFLHNYDGRRAAATILLTADVLGFARTHGVRGYRLVNAAVGAVCQALCLEGAHRGIGFGTALGFDAARHDAALGLKDVPQTPMLMMLAGRDTERSGAWHGRLHTLEVS